MEPAAAVAPDGKPSGTVAAGMELAGEVAPDGKPSGTVAAGMEPAGAVAPDGKPLGTVAAAASHDSEANMARLLRELGNNNNRRARFRTVIALIEKRDICPCGCTSIKQIHRFEGIVEGEITREKSGAEGFGYDPIFRPVGYDKTFAELGADIKNQISHRARATQKLAEYLKKK
ncbi:MAG: hypothetical protein IJ637_03140 [Prevotella sp.]|nr:hypothetical protein [Prevotella sp.]